MESNTRFVIDGSDLGRAPILKRCPCCGGIADYTRIEDGGRWYRATCSLCGMESAITAWPENAGEAWNRRITSGARVITTQEILEFKGEYMDDRGVTSCWMEHIDGRLRAVQLNVSTSMDGREVFERGLEDYWDREKVDAEGIRWRLWDKKPAKADRQREPWGKVAFQVMSDAARAEAERIQRALEEKRRAEEMKRAEDMRRHCLYCERMIFPEDAEGRKSDTPVCDLDGHVIQAPGTERCDQWTDKREEVGA